MIDRRCFVAALAFGTLAMPPIAPAQPLRKVARIGILGLLATADLAGPEPRSPAIIALLRGLRALGYAYGANFVTEARGAEGRPERFGALATELVRLQVDVIVASGSTLAALKQATSTIPVVMAASSDPVGQGFVRSLGRPGGNFTGLSLQSIDITGKRLQLLKEIVPGPAPVAVLWNQGSLLNWQAAEAAARERAWKVLSLEITDVNRIEAAFKAASDAGAGALRVFASGLLFPQAGRVAELAARSRLPAMYDLRTYVDAGGLVSYGPDINDVWHRAAVFVDKILKGARPADLPIEQPSKFELVISLKAAKALGITIPQSVLLRADEVIQ